MCERYKNIKDLYSLCPHNEFIFISTSGNPTRGIVDSIGSHAIWNHCTVQPPLEGSSHHLSDMEKTRLKNAHHQITVDMFMIDIRYVRYVFVSLCVVVSIYRYICMNRNEKKHNNLCGIRVSESEDQLWCACAFILHFKSIQWLTVTTWILTGTITCTLTSNSQTLSSSTKLQKLLVRNHPASQAKWIWGRILQRR